MGSQLWGKISRDEFDKVMREHGPQWSRMYFAPQTPEQNAENDREIQDGIHRVREHLRGHSKSETEAWLRYNLRDITGKCWELSYTSKKGHSQNDVIFATCGDDEICFCYGEPQTQEFLKQRIYSAIKPEGD